MPKRSVTVCILFGLYLTAWIIFVGGFLRNGLKEESNRFAQRLKEPISLLVEKAYNAKDDLAIQSTIQHLGHAPGISFASVLDRDEKILAHSRVALLGKTFKFPVHAKNIYSFPLRDESARWGTLIFSMSNQGSRELWNHCTLINVLAASFLCMGILGWTLIQEKRLEKECLAIAERDALLSTEKANIRRLEERLQSAQVAWSTLARSAVSRATLGLILLDQRQRVVAANPRAAQVLNSGDEAALIGKSWQELNYLESCGSALEKSLMSPGVDVQTKSPIDGSKIVLVTLHDGSGTWITTTDSSNQ